MGRLLGSITNAGIISRRPDLAVAVECLIDGAVHLAGELLPRGAVLAKKASNGKYRAYAEGILTAATAADSVDFAVDPAGFNVPFFKVGDAVEAVDGTALGTIATFDPATGAGTFAANAAAVKASGVAIRLAKSVAALDAGKGRVLMDEVLMAGSDELKAGLQHAYLVQGMTGITAAALSEMGGVAVTSGEVLIG